MRNLFRSNLLTAILLCLYVMTWTNTALGQIEEVVVTAQKRAENVQDVPISISTFSGDFMEDSGIHTLQELGQFTPNLTLSQSSQVANNRIIMRGVGSVGNNAIEPSVAVFIDGVYYPRPSSIVGSLTDLEMVEVLRGPQGTFFGRNASMGALNIRTRKPSDEFEGSIRGSYANFDAKRISGSFSGGLSDNAAGRLSFSYSDRDGYGDNTFTAGGSRDEVGAWEDASVRAKLYLTPTDNIDITLTVDYSSVDNEGGVIEVKTDTLQPAYLPTLSAILSGPAPDGSNTFDYDLNQDHRDKADDEQWGLSADISWSFAGHTIRSITSYRKWTNDTFESALRLPADLLNRVTAYETETFSQEIQILSPTGGKVEYVAGFYYYDEDYSIDQDFDLGSDFCAPVIGNLIAGRAIPPLASGLTPVFAGNVPLATAVAGGIVTGVTTTVLALTTAFGITPTQATIALGAADAASLTGLAPIASGACSAFPQTAAVDGEFQQDMTSIALYGQLTFNVTDRLSLTGGIRWTNDEKDGSYTQIVNNPILDSPVAPTGLPFSINLRINESFPNLKFDENEITWLGNARYYLTDDLMMFATVSTGYKSGGFNSDGANRVIPRTFRSETVDNYEIGFKSTLFDNRMIANLTFFRTEIDDFQDRQFDGVSFIVQNAGELRQQGIELDIQARPVDQLYAVLGVSYLDSEFQRFPDATPLPAVIASGSLTPQDLAGERNHFSPKWQLSMVAEWTDSLANTNWSWFVRGEYQFVDDQNVGAETNQNPQSLQESYGLFNAKLGLRGPADKWELSAFVKNAGDEGYCQTIFNQPIGTTLGLVNPAILGGDDGGMQRCVLGTPRTFGVEASYRF